MLSKAGGLKKDEKRNGHWGMPIEGGDSNLHTTNKFDQNYLYAILMS